MKEISIITGGSSGLGLSLAKKLIKAGENIAIVGRNEENILKAKDFLLSEGNGEVLSYCGNISDESFVKNLYSSLNKKQYIIKRLFNCAGVGKFGQPEITSREMINTVLEASLIGLMLMSANALEFMKQNGGQIINIMSSAALKGNPTETVYCAAKWGARGYTEALRAATKGTNIHVIGMYPGGINTPFWKPDSGSSPDTSKFMDPDEVAEQIIYAISTRNSMYVSDCMLDRK